MPTLTTWRRRDREATGASRRARGGPRSGRLHLVREQDDDGLVGGLSAHPVHLRVARSILRSAYARARQIHRHLSPSLVGTTQKETRE